MGYSTDSTAEVIKTILGSGIPALAPINFPVIDVRDVAAHTDAVKKSNAAGKHFIVTNQTLWAKEVADIISKEFIPQCYKIPSWAVPKVGV